MQPVLFGMLNVAAKAVKCDAHLLDTHASGLMHPTSCPDATSLAGKSRVAAWPHVVLTWEFTVRAVRQAVSGCSCSCSFSCAKLLLFKSERLHTSHTCILVMLLPCAGGQRQGRPRRHDRAAAAAQVGLHSHHAVLLPFRLADADLWFQCNHPSCALHLPTWCDLCDRSAAVLDAQPDRHSVIGVGFTMETIEVRGEAFNKR